jgi:hypothetical protein
VSRMQGDGLLLTYMAGEASTVVREPCKRCEGKGTVPAIVAGARLVPRGEHVRIE